MYTHVYYTQYIDIIYSVIVHCNIILCLDEVLLAPSQRPESPEFSRGEGVKTPPNLHSLHEEQSWQNEAEGYVRMYIHIWMYSIPL